MRQGQGGCEDPVPGAGSQTQKDKLCDPPPRAGGGEQQCVGTEFQLGRWKVPEAMVVMAARLWLCCAPGAVTMAEAG